MRHFFNIRIFWSCSVTEGGDGYYYHLWSNWFLAEKIEVFAGYSRHILISKVSSFRTLQERLKL